MKVAVALLALVCAQCLSAQEPVADAQAIEGRSVSQLRNDVTKAQKRFYALYNKLNKESGLTVECRDSETTGTKFRTRSCGAQADAESREQLGAYLSAMQQTQEYGASSQAARGVSPGGLPTGERNPDSAKGFDSLSDSANNRRLGALPAADTNQDRLRAHIQELIDKHPELRQLADEHAAAVRRYELARTPRTKPAPGK